MHSISQQWSQEYMDTRAPDLHVCTEQQRLGILPIRDAPRIIARPHRHASPSPPQLWCEPSFTPPGGVKLNQKERSVGRARRLRVYREIRAVVKGALRRVRHPMVEGSPCSIQAFKAQGSPVICVSSVWHGLVIAALLYKCSVPHWCTNTGFTPK